MSTLPTWDEMTDHDRGAALAYAWQCRHRGVPHAQMHAPCRYIDSPLLVDLDPVAAGGHALAVCGPIETLLMRLGKPEYDRLYNLALPPATY